MPSWKLYDQRNLLRGTCQVKNSEYVELRPSSLMTPSQGRRNKGQGGATTPPPYILAELKTKPIPSIDLLLLLYPPKFSEPPPLWPQFFDKWLPPTRDFSIGEVHQTCKLRDPYVYLYLHAWICLVTDGDSESEMKYKYKYVQCTLYIHMYIFTNILSFHNKWIIWHRRTLLLFRMCPYFTQSLCIIHNRLESIQN